MLCTEVSITTRQLTKRTLDIKDTEPFGVLLTMCYIELVYI